MDVVRTSAPAAAGAALLLALAGAGAPARAERAPLCVSGPLPGGAQYVIAAPEGWDPARGELLVLAPGYVFPDAATAPPAIDPALLEALDGLDFAVAGLTYRRSGLAVKEGTEDLEQLLELFATDPYHCGYGRASHAYVLGASEGGLIATRVAERQALAPQPLIDGVLAACGPVGDFRRQLEYITDFRVIFDALFPGVLPGSAVAIPAELSGQWDAVYRPQIEALVEQRPVEIERLLRAAGAAYVPGDPATVQRTVLTLLEYNARATNDAIAILGGRPFENLERAYGGSGDAATDALINARAERFTADPAALAELEAHYQTSGALARAQSGGSDVPVVTLHTRLDPLVPYWHAPLYGRKALGAGAFAEHAELPVERYGHCAFEPQEILRALGVLMLLD